MLRLDHRAALAATSLLTLSLAASPSIAHACGGFFCDGANPVIQTGERILFEVDSVDDRVTAVVEIQYQGQPENFSWVLPVPAGVGPGDVDTVPPGLFDSLEQATAPAFWRVGAVQETSDSSRVFGCFGSSSSASGDDDDDDGDESSSATLLGTADVGPYAIELVEAGSGDSLEEWLTDNGYQAAPGLAEVAQPYVAADMNFLALRLAPERFDGVIEAVSYTWDGDVPMIPLVLTSVAAMSNMQIIAYVLADEQYKPAGYATAEVDFESVEFDAAGTDYTWKVEAAVEAMGGRAFITEFAGAASSQYDDVDADTRDWLEHQPYLTRFRTYIDPDDMTSDPLFVPAPERPDLDNVHRLVESSFGTAAMPMLLLLFTLAARRRRS